MSKLTQTSKLNIKNRAINIAKKIWLHVVVLAISLSVLAYVLLDKSSKQFKEVLVANNKLIAGQKINESDLTVKTLPLNANLNGLIDAKSKGQAIGKVISNNLLKDDLILSHNIFNDKDDANSTNISDSSKKLFYITSKDVEVIPYNIKPNNKIFVFGNDTKTNKNEVILANVKVIQTDRISKEQNKAPNYIAVELSDNEILAITNVLSNRWYLQMVLAY